MQATARAYLDRKKLQLREGLARRQDGICPVCTLPLPEDVMSDDAEVDHIIPRALVG